MNNLLTLFHQLKRNAQCVACALGGGQLGYLGLILSQEAYEKIHQAEPFICPKNLGLFRRVTNSSNPSPPKRTRAQTVDTASEIDDLTVTLTAANVAQ